MKQPLNIGFKIKSIRQSKGMTAKFVASKVGISPSALCKYENNKRAIRADLLPTFADVLGVKLQDFFDEKVGVMPTKQPA